MNHADWLRNRAVHLFALALQARDRGDVTFADELVAVANEALDQAQRLEHEAGAAPPPLMAGADPKAVVRQQQQQQEQPKKSETGDEE